MKTFYDVATHSLVPELVRKMAMYCHLGLTQEQAISDHSKAFRLSERQSRAYYKQVLQMLEPVPA